MKDGKDQIIFEFHNKAMTNSETERAKIQSKKDSIKILPASRRNLISSATYHTRSDNFSK